MRVPVDPEVDAQIDGRWSEFINQDHRLWRFQHRVMFAKHVDHNFLGSRNGIRVVDTNHKVAADVRICGRVVNDALVDNRVGYLHVVAVHCHQ